MLVRFVINFSVQSKIITAVFDVIFAALIQGLNPLEQLFLMKPGFNCQAKRQR